MTYVAPDHSFTLQVPEGWAQTTSATTVVFTDKFNSITLTPRSGFYAPDEEYARTVELPEIASSTRVTWPVTSRPSTANPDGSC